MGMYDLITKKKQGEALSKEEINFIIEGFTNGNIPDYQMSAFLMAVCLKGMNLQPAAGTGQGNTVKPAIQPLQGIQKPADIRSSVEEKSLKIPDFLTRK